MKRVINSMIIILLLCLITGVGAFIYNGEQSYTINNNFVSLPLNFDPDNCSSTYKMDNCVITVYGGFVKGIQKESDEAKILVIRALSPLPAVSITGENACTLSLLIENVSPEFYAKSIAGLKLSMSGVSANTLRLRVPVKAEETVAIRPTRPKATGSTGEYKYILLGDNRDGYDTFGQIIDQVNGEAPVFVIDNGDLVFSGKPNQYRLFDQMTSKISSTLCTTPGNHDIRDDGRSIYTMLYGPSYYSFDFSDSHFVFLDSSPGWTQKRAISEAQYVWLERDLLKAQGKRIYVITHIPPYDPRSGITPSQIPNYVNQAKSGEDWVEQELDNYYATRNMNHAFQDPQEAARFEKIMSSYHVDTVYLSHIHSYLEYTRDGVRYLISGGAGAELLTENSYYHYVIEKVGGVDSETIVELPSPENNYLPRYLATAQLFATAMYEENPVSVVLVITGLAALVLLLIIKIYLRKKQPLDTFGHWLLDVGRYGTKHFKELFAEE